MMTDKVHEEDELVVVCLWCYRGKVKKTLECDSPLSVQ